jgi:aspartate 1-decarboxylase
MMRQFLLSKIHRAVVTAADLHYVGSITLDPVLMRAAELLPWEKVQIVDIENGARFETYVIPGQKDSGDVQLNGAAARLVQLGDHIIIMSYAWLSEEKPDRFPSKSSVCGRTQPDSGGEDAELTPGRVDTRSFLIVII